MKRKAYSDLLRWKDSKTRKPLLLLGARQVGKTWLMKEFGRNEYENIVYVNCDTEPLTKELFLPDYDISRILLGLQAITGQSISEISTLIILDEIQEAPRGLHSLKYFCENAPGYHVMAAGSLLGVTLNQQQSFPVGKVEMLQIYPLDFEEFIDAVGQHNLGKLLKNKDYSLVDSLSSKYTELLYQYYYVGGMPEVVKAFVDHRDLNEVRQLQNDIVTAYRMDISKHTTKTESVRIGQVLASLPSQLARENKKFLFGAARPGGRAGDFEVAIQWLVDAGLIIKVCRVNKIAAPLKFYEDISAFKLFFLDVGLLGCMAGLQAADILLNPGSLTEYRGMMTEQFVAQQLTAAGISLYYWSNDRTPAEIDFLFQRGQEIIPVEVKASTNVKGKSLRMFLTDNPSATAIRYSLLPYCVQDRLTNYPLYSLPYSLQNQDNGPVHQ